MLTQLENRILDYISSYIAIHDQSPTLREIGDELQIRSKGTVHRYVQSLVKKGQLRRNSRGWRSIDLTAQNSRRLTILPLLGGIEAGKPIKPIPSQSEFNFSAELLGADRFVLKVIGEGMEDAGLRDGDMVIVRQSDTAGYDDLVVALIDDGEITLKRMRKHGDRIELIPANKSEVSLIYPTERVHIQGVVVGQLRLY